MCNEDPYQQVDTTDLIDITWGDAARSQIGEVFEPGGAAGALPPGDGLGEPSASAG